MDIVERIIFDDSQAIPALQNVTKQTENLQKGFQEMNAKSKKATEELANKVQTSSDKVNGAIDKTIKKNKEAGKSFSDMVRPMGVFGAAIAGGIDKLNEYRGTFGKFMSDHVNWGKLSETNKQGVEALARAFGGGTKALTIFAKGLNIVKSALISTGIGALIVGLGSLIAFFTRTQEGMDKIKVAGAGVGAAFRVLTDKAGEVGKKIVEAFENPKQAVSDLWTAIKENLVNRLEAFPLLFTAIGGALKDLFTGDWKGLKSNAGDIAQSIVQMGTGLDKVQQGKIADLGNEMKDAYDAAAALEQKMINLQREVMKFGATEASLNAHVAKQREISKDTSKSLQERIKASLKAVEIDDKIDKQKMSFALRELNIIKEQNALRKKNDKDIQAEVAAQTKYYNLLAEDANANIRFNKAINSTIDQAVDLYKEAGDAVYDLAETYGLMNEQQRRAADRTKEIENLKLLKTNLDQIVNTLKDKELSDSQKTILDRLGITNVGDIDKVKGELDKLMQAIVNTEAVDKLLDESKSKELDALKEISANADLSTAQQEQQKTRRKLVGEAERLQITMNGLKKEDEAYKENELRLQEIKNQIAENDKANFLKAALEKNEALRQNERLWALQTIKDKEVQNKVLESIDAEYQINALTLQNEFLDKNSAAYAENLAKIQEIQNKYDVVPKKWWEDVKTFEELWNNFLINNFGEEGAKDIKKFIDGLGEFVSQWGAILDESTEIQLKNIDKQLEKISERKDKAEADLEKEKELYEQGLANNYASKQQEVDGIIAEEKRLNDEKEKLQKQAERRKLISDSLQQASSLITSSIQIIQGFAPLGPFGLPLGIAAVAALFAFFAKTKIDAFKATKLHTGAERINDYFGFAARSGETDLPGSSGKGYRLVNERSGIPTNVIISGKEMLIPEKVSLRNAEFFSNLRMGLYEGIDLSEAIGFYKTLKVPKGNIIQQNNVMVQNSKAKMSPVAHLIPIGNGKYLVYELGKDQGHGSIIEIKS